MRGALILCKLTRSEGLEFIRRLDPREKDFNFEDLQKDLKHASEGSFFVLEIHKKFEVKREPIVKEGNIYYPFVNAGSEQ